MICPNCEAEYIVGVKICSDCGTELISKEEFEKSLIKYKDWTTIFKTNEMYEAEMIKANLAGGEIDSIILSQKDKNFPGVGDLSIIKVLVKKIDEEDAKIIISDINEKSAE